MANMGRKGVAVALLAALVAGVPADGARAAGGAPGPIATALRGAGDALGLAAHRGSVYVTGSPRQEAATPAVSTAISTAVSTAPTTPTTAPPLMTPTAVTIVTPTTPTTAPPLTPTTPTTPTTPAPPATATPAPSATPLPRPTNTPRPRHVVVRVLSVGVYTVTRAGERGVTTAGLTAPIRLKIVVLVQNAPRAGVSVIALWSLRSATGKTVLSDQRTFLLANGRTGLYDDVVLPDQGLGTGSYVFQGGVLYQGRLLRATTPLRVTGQQLSPEQRHVHYAHLRLTAPVGWTLDFSRNSSGRRATGPDSLIMFSATRRAAVSVVSVRLRKTPSNADLRAFPALVLQQEFNGVDNIKPLAFKSRIDGHDVFAAQGGVTVNGRTSTAVAIVTNKGRQFYAFTVVNLFRRAPAGEIQAGLTSIFGARLD